MNREEFWEKWNYCDFAEYGYGGDPTPEELKKEMFEDLDALCDAYLSKNGPCVHEISLLEPNPVVYDEIPDELIYNGHLWHRPRVTEYTTGIWVCSLCGCDSDDNITASKKCTGGANENVNTKED